MRKLILLFPVLFVVITGNAQDNAAMEARAKEFIRVVGVDDPEQWKKFVKENYTKAMIERKPQMRRVVEEGNGPKAEKKEEDPAKETPRTEADKIAVKADLFRQLNADFGAAKIISTKHEGEKTTMLVSGVDGRKASFIFTFDPKESYRINAIGIEMTEVADR